MRAVAYRVHRSLRRRWHAAAVVAGVVAVVTAAVLCLAAGARRTANAPDAYTASVGGEPDALVTQSGGPARTDEVATLASVQSIEPITFLFASLSVPNPASQPGFDVISFAGVAAHDGPRLLAGRLPDPDHPEEFVAGRQFVDQQHARLGDRFPFVSWSGEQVAQGVAFADPPNGPAFDGVLVGVLSSPDALEDEHLTVVFPESLLAQDIGLGQTLMTVRTQPGVTAAQLRADLDALPGGTELAVGPGQLVGTEVRNAVDAQARGLWIMAIVAAIAAVVALGQLLSRHARLSPLERRPLGALGYTSGQLTAESLARAAVPSSLGVALGALLAIAASGVFPAGFVRQLEPHPGLHVDPVVLGLGALALLLALMAWTAVALLAHQPASGRTASLTSESIARRAPSPAASTGIRFALAGHDRSAASAIGTLVALGLLVAGLVGAFTFATSIDRLVSDRSHFGGNYDFGVGTLGPVQVDRLRSVLGGDPDIDGLMILTGGQARVGDTTVGLIGVEHVQGELAPRVLAGRLPAGPDEVALGRLTAHELHASVGSELALEGAAGSGTYRVVGLAVVPGMGAVDGAGMGAVVTSDGLVRLAEPEMNMAAVVLRSGAPAGTADRVAKLVDDTPGREDPPSAILNVARVRLIPALLAGLLALLALLTLIHALLVSIQSRRRDLAVLRALGADGRWIGRTVHWQATVLAAAPLVVGVPLGIVAGSVVFRAFANGIGALPDPTMSVALLALLVGGLLLVANLVAVLPARRARLVSTAQLLRDE